MDLKLKNWKSALAFVVLAFVNLLTNAGEVGGSNPLRSSCFCHFGLQEYCRVIYICIYMLSYIGYLNYC